MNLRRGPAQCGRWTSERSVGLLVVLLVAIAASGCVGGASDRGNGDGDGAPSFETALVDAGDDGCRRPEPLSGAWSAVAPDSDGAVAMATLTALDAAALERLYLAAPAAGTAMVAGRSGTVTRVESQQSGVSGALSFRPAETTAGDAAIGYATADSGSPSILRAYRTASYWDACDALRLSFDLNPNDAETRRGKFELRQLTGDILLGMSFGAADLDRNGDPIQPLGERTAFDVVVLDDSSPYVPPVGVGYPWDPTTPVSGTCPEGWSRPFPVDPTEYPFTDRCVDLRFGTVHYIDESPAGTPRGTVLMAHGNPVWSFVYRHIASDLLAAGFRVVAPDLYGFGMSDKPGLEDFPDLTTYGYTPHEQSATVEEFIEALDLRDVTLMVQDWGGPTGLAAAAHLPSRVRDLVVMNTWASNAETETPWGVYNRVNTDKVVATAETPKRTGQNMGRLYGPEGSDEHVAVRNGYWGPFIDPATGLALTPTVAAPTNIFARNIYEDRDFLGELDRNVRRFLRTHDVAFLYTIGPNEDLDDGVGNDDGLARFLSFWEPSSVKLDLRDPDATHFIQETNRADIVAAVELLHR